MENKISNPKHEKKAKKRGQGATPAQRAARSANIASYRASVGGRTALRHGLHVILASEGHEIPAVPDGAQVAADADAIIGQMVADLGGEAELTAQKRAILESQRMCLLVLGLSNSFIRREGLLNRRGKPHPLLSTVVSFANTLRLNAVVLGLERRARKVGPASLHEYLEQKAREPEVPSEAPRESAANEAEQPR